MSLSIFCIMFFYTLYTILHNKDYQILHMNSEVIISYETPANSNYFTHYYKYTYSYDSLASFLGLAGLY